MDNLSFAYQALLKSREISTDECYLASVDSALKSIADSIDAIVQDYTRKEMLCTGYNLPYITSMKLKAVGIKKDIAVFEQRLAKDTNTTTNKQTR